MADQLVAATIGVYLEKAISIAANRIGLVLGVGFHKDLEAFKERAEDIQAVLVDAEKKQTQSQFVLRWLRRVEAVAIDAEYVLDELLYESLRRKVESMNKAKRAAKVCLFFSLSKHDISFRWRMGSKVREINGKFEKFIREASQFGLISAVNSVATFEVAKSRETNSLLPQFVVGRDEEESKIVDMLLSGSSKATASVSVISIVGMGGLGKTTLAKSIYNNPGINTHFDQKLWVCVSENFEVTELFRLMLQSLKGGKVERFGQDGIVQKIREELSGKRFLVILDDVWNEERKLWNDFFTSLVGINTASGSSCLVTTRSQKTAELMSTFPPVVLDKLGDDDCWYILCRKATQNGEMPQELDVSNEQVLQSSQEIDGEMLERIKVHRELMLKGCQELEVHREQILKRCQGLPLAANVVGGLLSLQRRENWLRVVENKILAGELVEGEIEAILKLSFDYLPSLSIKKCFAYCSVYSKDTVISDRELIELWMAEGFLQEGVERISTMEEVGGDYLRILLQSSLLEKAGKNWWGENIYQMHDLVHDLAESLSKRERTDGEVSHLAFRGIKYNAKSTCVRIVEGEIPDMMLLKFKRLRVLNLNGMGVENFPNAISKVKHLRYLHAPYSKMKTLPGALCKLYNLQTLDLSGCSYLKCLPHGLSDLISLRHLHFDPKDIKFKMAPNMGRLTSLQTLSFFNVGEEKGNEIKEVGSMKNLAGKIRLSNLELVKGKEGAGMANLFEKKRLKGLDLFWGGENGNCNGHEHVLEGLEPHPNLQELSLEKYMGARLPQWFGHKLEALTELRFINCKSLRHLPTLGHLHCLQVLEITGSENVTCIGESFYVVEGLWELGKVFPSLKTMKLKNLPNLSEWKGLDVAVKAGPVFPKLESLDIIDCCQLASVPSPFPSLEHLEIVGNIQVSVVRDIIGKRASFLKTLGINYMDGLDSLADVIENPLTYLRYFSIYCCDNLIEIPNSALEFCASLEELVVRRCPKLMLWALNLQRTPSLSSLHLNCPNMFSTNVMPTGFRYLTNLGSLTIGPFTDDSIQSFDWSGLIACSSTLTTLYWSGSLQEHSGLPQQLQHLTSLQYLTFNCLKSVEALPDWLGKLTSLYRLEVRDCPMLQCLPSAHAMGRLTNLRDLVIQNCPLLPERSIQDVSSTLPNLYISRY